MFDWIRDHETLLWWMAIISGIMFIATLIVVPLIIVRIPADYFATARRHKTAWGNQHPVIRAALLVTKNGLGAVLILVGIAMLVLPGQGLLTILVGIMFLDFPGKFRLERWIVTRNPVLSSINWLRKKTHQPNMIVDE